MTEQVWGYQIVVTKDMAHDAAVDVDRFLELQFLRTLPDGWEMLDDKPAFEWWDLDERPDPFSGFTLDDGTEIPPITNAYRIRGTARIVQREAT